MFLFFTGNRGLFGTQMNIYGGAFLWKKLKATVANIQKKLHISLLVGFQIRLLAILSKNSHLKRYFPGYVKRLVSSFLSFHTNEKNVLQRQIKDWSFEFYLFTGEPSQFMISTDWIIENNLWQILSGSWIFCRMEIVGIIFCWQTSSPNSVK